MDEMIQPTGPGKALQSARTHSGLSVEEVARRLKLSIRYIEAMEANDYTHGPNLAYVRGYLRAYAKLLQLPEHLILNDFETLGLQEETVELTDGMQQHIPLNASSSNLKWGVMALSFVLLGVGIYLMLQDNGRIGRVGRANAMSETHQSSEPRPLSPHHDDTAVTEQTDVDHSNPDIEFQTFSPFDILMDENPERLKNALKDITVLELSSHVDSPFSKGELRLSFTDDCWIRVQDADQNRMASGMMTKGHSITLQGKTPLFITIGNAPATQLLFNGQEISLTPDPENHVVHLTLS